MEGKIKDSIVDLVCALIAKFILILFASIMVHFIAAEIAPQFIEYFFTNKFMMISFNYEKLKELFSIKNIFIILLGISSVFGCFRKITITE